ncbi:hypothetical protein LTR95_003109 [Oleoguttula sp. CCFEE 5521]
MDEFFDFAGSNKFKNLSASAIGAMIVDPFLAQHESINKYLEERDNDAQHKAQQHRSSTPCALSADMCQSPPSQGQLNPRYSKMQQDRQRSAQHASAMSFDPMFTAAQQTKAPSSFNDLGLAQYKHTAFGNLELGTLRTTSPSIAGPPSHRMQPSRQAGTANTDVVSGAARPLVPVQMAWPVGIDGSRKRKRNSLDASQVQNEGGGTHEHPSTFRFNDQGDDGTWTPANGSSSNPTTSTKRRRKSSGVTEQSTTPPTPITTSSRIPVSSQSNVPASQSLASWGAVTM